MRDGLLCFLLSLSTLGLGKCLLDEWVGSDPTQPTQNKTKFTPKLLPLLLSILRISVWNTPFFSSLDSVLFPFSFFLSSSSSFSVLLLGLNACGGGCPIHSARMDSIRGFEWILPRNFSSLSLAFGVGCFFIRTAHFGFRPEYINDSGYTK